MGERNRTVVSKQALRYSLGVLVAKEPFSLEMAGRKVNKSLSFHQPLPIQESARGRHKVFAHIKVAY